ncbi:hypothetical protein DXG03_004931 [Asterophora parasitica]|uniref:HPt domain-containing protein n=1 Tax=Asterophora parasitica TaxID=117018 RepID=A0A9P7KG89_9AGAR|nr:hypothetical protein DXG03_004931 [Asterophora parasitica]
MPDPLAKQPPSPVKPPSPPATATKSPPPPSPTSPKSPSPAPKSPSPATQPTPAPVSPPSTVTAPAPAAEPSTPSQALPDPEADQGIIDMETFQQILDLDEDTTHDFSRGMAWAYFTQAEQTFKEMDEALLGKNLAQLSSLGHFLKGSSAALGLSKVQASCEKIQHYGQQRDEEAGKNLTVEGAITRIGALLSQVNEEYSAAETWLKNWYDEHADPEDGEPDAPPS